jgi:hypothetical protein
MLDSSRQMKLLQGSHEAAVLLGHRDQGDTVLDRHYSKGTGGMDLVDLLLGETDDPDIRSKWVRFVTFEAL